MTQSNDTTTRPPNPLLAGLLSALLPGAGHFYAGRSTAGVLYGIAFLSMLGLIFWVSSTVEFEVFRGLIGILIGMLAVFWLWLIANAYLAAQGKTFVNSFGLILLLVFTYLIGWQATEVNLRKFFTEFPDTYRILTRVMWPWNAAIDREEELIVGRTAFYAPCEAGLPDPERTGPEGEAWIIVTPNCGEFSQSVAGTGFVAGTQLSIHGEGFLPNDEVEIWWEDPLGEEFRVFFSGETISSTTDARGRFTVNMPAPQYFTPGGAVGVQEHVVQARQVGSVGPVRLSQDFRLVTDRLMVTIFQALMATTLGIVLALPFSFLASRNLMWENPFARLVYFLVRFVMNVTRSIEPIIWAVIAVVWVGLGPFAGVLALMIHTVASLAKLYSEAIESIDPGPIEAITATGATRLQVIVYAIIPQIIPPFLSFTLYRWDINVRMSTIIGFVGGGGIGQILYQWINQSLWTSAGMGVWLIALTVSLMDFASSELRKRFI